MTEMARGKYKPKIETLEIFPGLGIKGTGGTLKGPARKTGNIKYKGEVIGSRIAKAGSKKAMGISRTSMTQSDYALKQQIKQVKKMPDKKFTSVNLEKVKVTSDRTGKSFLVNKTDPVKGSVGKKNYIKMMKYYHHRNKPKYTG